MPFIFPLNIKKIALSLIAMYANMILMSIFEHAVYVLHMTI